MRHFLPVVKIALGITILVIALCLSHTLAQRIQAVSSPRKSEVVHSSESAPADNPEPLIVHGSTVEELANKIEKASQSANYEPGTKAFRSASELLSNGYLFEAEQKLINIVKTYPYTSSSIEARRILGEINIDRFFSEDVTGGKKNYTVQSGDSFYKIASKHETSLENIVALNGLLTLDNLHQGDDLTLMPLLFNLIVDIPNKRLTLEYGKTFVKDYPFIKLVTKKQKENKKSLIKSIFAISPDGKKVIPTNLDYREAFKILQITHPPLDIVPEGFSLNPAFQGIVLKPEDAEELSLLMRKGNMVEILY